LSTNSSSIPFPQHDPLTLKQLLLSLIFGCVKQYFQTTCISAPFSFAPTSSYTTSALIALHHELNGYFPLFLENYKPDKDLELSSNSFKLAFQHMLHLLINDPSGMVFEHLWECFHPEDSTSGFLQLFQLYSHIT
jgi:hypothetical protein